MYVYITIVYQVTTSCTVQAHFENVQLTKIEFSWTHRPLLVNTL